MCVYAASYHYTIIIIIETISVDDCALPKKKTFIYFFFVNDAQRRVPPSFTKKKPRARECECVFLMRWMGRASTNGGEASPSIIVGTSFLAAPLFYYWFFFVISFFFSLYLYYDQKNKSQARDDQKKHTRAQHGPPRLKKWTKWRPTPFFSVRGKIV